MNRVAPRGRFGLTCCGIGWRVLCNDAVERDTGSNIWVVRGKGHFVVCGTRCNRSCMKCVDSVEEISDDLLWDRGEWNQSNRCFCMLVGFMIAIV